MSYGWLGKQSRVMRGDDNAALQAYRKKQKAEFLRREKIIAAEKLRLQKLKKKKTLKK